MDIDLIFKIAAVGIIVSILNQVLVRSGREEQATMTFEGPDDELDVEGQINILDAVIAENPDALCISAGDMESCQAQLEAARENGIPVVAFDANVSETDLICAYRGTDNTYTGEIAAEKLAEAIGEKGKVAVFSAQEKTKSIKDRSEGFQNKMKDYPDIEITDILYEDQVEDMDAAMRQVLEKNPDLAGVFCTNSESTEAYLNLEKPSESLPVLVAVSRRLYAAEKNWGLFPRILMQWDTRQCLLHFRQLIWTSRRKPRKTYCLHLCGWIWIIWTAWLEVVMFTDRVEEHRTGGRCNL